jgi:Holliday junction DNA helicase RuvB
MATQSQASKIRRALIKTDRLSERQNQGNLAAQSHGSKVTTIFVTTIARLPKSKCRDDSHGLPLLLYNWMKNRLSPRTGFDSARAALLFPPPVSLNRYSAFIIHTCTCVLVEVSFIPYNLPMPNPSSHSGRPLDPESKPDDRVDNALRPQKLNDLIGQDQVKENLSILIAAARGRGEALDHVLFYGPPGLGKTTLAHVVANEMGVNVKVTAGPAIERAGDLAAILTNLRQGDVLFIDEIHRLGRAVEEVLYPAMEDFSLDIVIGKGPSARSIRLKLPRFTVVGATTRLALVTAPLRARFGAVYRLDYYDIEAMRQIVARASGMLKVPADESGIGEVARRARGTPRIALRLLRRVRDYAQVRADGVVTSRVAMEALDLLQVDPLGLDDVDRRVLKTIIEKYNGGPVGLNTIAASISEEQDTIMDVVEPYLLQLGFLDRTPQGRVATKSAYEHLNLPYSEEGQPRLL